MTISSSPADMFEHRLASRSALSVQDRADIQALPFIVRHHDPSTYLIREGQVPRRCYMVIEGFAYRQKITAGGSRQIVGLLVPGDLIDLQNLHLYHSDHSVQALTRIMTAEIDMAVLRELSIGSRGIGTAMWVDSLIEASVMREWLLNIGRRDARSRLAHLICEFVVRCEVATVPDAATLLPLTQEQLGDALGLTAVHVNRVLKGLHRDGLIERHRRHIAIGNWDALREVADFSRMYLHLDQIEPVAVL